MKAINIKWDTDGDNELLNALPKVIEIPNDFASRVEDLDDRNEKISNYISDQIGFCHFGFNLVEED